MSRQAKATLVAMAITSLGACQGASETLPAETDKAVEIPMTALGQEPGWILRLQEDDFTLEYQYGEHQLATDTPEPQSIDNGIRYQSTGESDFTIDITHRYCEDIMSGRPFPYTVAITLSDQTLHGCGGDTQGLIVGQKWVLKNINDDPVEAGARITLNFTEDNQVYGSAGCNRFTGQYDITGEGISVGALALTRRACESALMVQESAFGDALQAINNFRIDDSGALLLTSHSGERLEARPGENRPSLSE